MDTYKVDYHIHSYYSDGLNSPIEIVKKFHEEGYDIISITDHDGIAGLTEALNAGEALNMQVITGVEFSTDFEGKELHILGYKFDPENKELKNTCENLAKVRKERNEKLVLGLKDLGYEIDLAELEKASKTGYVGKPSMAREMCKKGYIDNPKEAFSDKIFGSKEMESIKKEVLDSVKAIEIINNALGMAVLAHPMKIKGIGERGTDEFWENLSQIIYKLKKAGLKGIECIYPEHSLGEQHKISQLASKYHLHMTEGSDFHGGDM